MTITVYTKPQCVQCGATIKALDKAGLEYTLVDITADDHWAGFRPDRIKNLAAHAA